MAESDKRCVPPCQRLIPEDDPHRLCFECLGDENAALGLEEECEHCDLFVSGYVCNRGSPSGEQDTASPRGRYGERPQRDSCLKIHM